jgi:hypothetical protein
VVDLARRAWRPLLAAAAVAALATAAFGAETVTPGVAAGGVPLTTTVDKVMAILGRPTNEAEDPSNSDVILQRWEARCLGARYTRAGRLLALDVWTDLGGQCGGAPYNVEGASGRRVTFASRRADVKAAFGYAPERVLKGFTFTILVYDGQGVAFYMRDQGIREGLVDAITIFPRGTSRSVWAPDSWGGR